MTMESSVPQPVTGKPSNYFNIHMKLLKYSGISLTGNDSIAYKLYSFLLLSSTVFSYTIFGIRELFKVDAEIASDFIIYVSGCLVALVKVSIIYVNRVKFGEVLAKLEQEPFLPNPDRRGDEEEKLIQGCHQKVKVQSYAFWITVAATQLFCDLYAFSTRLRSTDYHDWMLPYGPLTALNITYSPNYEISVLYQSISIGVIGCCYITTDLIIAAVFMHISCQFKILQNFLKHIVEHSYEEMLKDTANISTALSSGDEIDGSVIAWKYLSRSLKKAVRYHLSIMNIAKEMEELFCYLLLVTFLVNLGCFCFEIYQASLQKTALGLLYYFGEFLDGVFSIIIVCYWGEQILVESQQVGDAAYESNFVGTDLRFQKSLILIMRRSQIPTKITAGKFTDICLATFVWVMKTSYSIFTVIRNLKQNEM